MNLTTKKTLVIGASLKGDLYSNKAIKRLLEHKHNVLAIGHKEGQVEDVVIETSKSNYQDIDTITLYLNPKRQIEYYDYILSLNPNRVIFNPGTENAELQKLLLDNNINYENSCTLVLLATQQY